MFRVFLTPDGRSGETAQQHWIPLRFEELVKIFRTAGDELRAFSATCTHLDCTVQYKKDMGLIWCACHNGKYDLNGRNVSGPPPRPLDEYRVVVQGGEILISKKA